MRLCIGTSKGIVIIDPARSRLPLMVLADPTAVWCMAQDCVDPAVIYAGATEHVRGRGTLARSLDGGRSWTDISPAGGRDEEVWAVAASLAIKDQVFVGTSHARLFRSDDRGRSFRECAGFLKIPGRDRWSFPPPPHIPHVRSITFDPHSSLTMYVGVEEGGIYRSRDAGATFEPLNDGLYADVHSIAIGSRDSRRLYATTGNGFYRSDNGGGSWRRVTDGIDRTTQCRCSSPTTTPTPSTLPRQAPLPTWSIGHAGADAALYRSEDGAAGSHRYSRSIVWGRA